MEAKMRTQMSARVALEGFPRPLEKRKVSNEARERFDSEGRTQVIVFVAVFPPAGSVGVPVGDGGNPSGECPRGLNIGSESGAQRTEHFIHKLFLEVSWR
jgi:hypothetical protein